MLASIFISQGVKAVADPSSTVVQGEMLRDRVSPLVRRVAPDPIAARLPEGVAAWSRIRGVAEILGGLGLSTGIGRRGSALLLAACNVQDLLATGALRRTALSDPDVLTKVALTGSVLLAAQDTEGRPGIGYRSRKAGRRAAVEGRRARTAARRTARAARRGAGQVATELTSDLAA